MSQSTLQPLTYCKNKACGKPITVKNVHEEREIEEAPHHIIIEYKCFNCTQEDQMVGTRESWEQFLSEDMEEEDSYQRALRDAEVELGGIESAQDLINLWHSYNRPPILEDRIGACKCLICEKRNYE
jgi:hypothetical protein